MQGRVDSALGQSAYVFSLSDKFVFSSSEPIQFGTVSLKLGVNLYVEIFPLKRAIICCLTFYLAWAMLSQTCSLFLGHPVRHATRSGRNAAIEVYYF